ncbi:MAG: BolA family transcriptional regulator [Alphaproteobacteria bacterium]|nr:BolA family transcriptional regulator [Alphaproteobacteria bacterium]
MTVAESIKSKLTAALAPSELEIEDESHKHAGHSGWRPGGETHFRVRVTSTLFMGKSRVDRHRLVHAALQEELATQVHALALELKTPDEQSR